MASFVPTSAETLEDQRLYTSARLVEVACLDCLARVGVKKNSEHHTSIQWTTRTRCAPARSSRGWPASAGRASAARRAARGWPPSIEAAVRDGQAADRRRGRILTPAMETERFELKVLDVVEETGDARSISFEVPEGAAEHVRLQAGPVPHPRRAERPDRRRRPLLLAVAAARTTAAR